MEERQKSADSPFRLWLLGGAVVGGWFAAHLSQQRMVRREMAELRQEIRRQSWRLDELEKALPATAEEPAAIMTAMPQQKSGSQPLSPPSPAVRAGEEIAPETLAVIAAAVTAFLGKKVRIHQARLVNPEVVSPWAQQGRVYVQASHNLGRR